MRLAVYTDYAYHRAGEEVLAERAFALFVARLRDRFERLVLVGREAPPGERARYPVGTGVELVALPYYASLAHPWSVMRVAARSLTRFWRALRDVDAVWLLGPHPFAVAFALVSVVRRKRVVLGVRQDTPAYIRSRHPGRRSFAVAASLLDAAWRGLARFLPVVVVGGDMARRYAGSVAVLEIAVSLVDEGDLVSTEDALARPWNGELQLLSVGRLEEEKNPLLLAEVLARLVADRSRWRLVVCGEGPMADDLVRRAEELGVRDRLEIAGYVPFGPELMALYRGSHALLHVSWTEGLPQVLLEAFAAGTPVVATNVGGVGSVGDAALLVDPGDGDGAARALLEIANDATVRARLVRAGHAYVGARTATVESRRVADFLQDS